MKNGPHMVRIYFPFSTRSELILNAQGMRAREQSADPAVRTQIPQQSEWANPLSDRSVAYLIFHAYGELLQRFCIEGLGSFYPEIYDIDLTFVKGPLVSLEIPDLAYRNKSSK